MLHRVVSATNTFLSWRSFARECLNARIAPPNVLWSIEGSSSGDLFGANATTAIRTSEQIYKVPKLFMELAHKVVCHSDPERFSILYELLWNCVDDQSVIGNALHPLVYKTGSMAKSVSRDMHKMKAFVRFKEELKSPESRRKFSAWFEPEHFIVQETSAFFERRFNDMDWFIATPMGTALFVDSRLTFDAKPAARATIEDDTEKLWKTYYANIFNPARLKLNAMRSEMPKKYWHNLPETVQIKELVSTAGRRVEQMRKSLPSAPSSFAAAARAATVVTGERFLKHFSSISEINAEVLKCRRCPLYCNATQAVGGEGAANAKLMIVGEQPGHEEDLVGRPFVGPSGKLFDQALKAGNISREDVYVSNAVKHFKFEPRGKRRIHQRPNAGEIQHCKYWLISEIEMIRPKLILAMGATAVGALTGSDKNIGKRRGQVERPSNGQAVMITPQF